MICRVHSYFVRVYQGKEGMGRTRAGDRGGQDEKTKTSGSKDIATTPLQQKHLIGYSIILNLIDLNTVDLNTVEYS